MSVAAANRQLLLSNRTPFGLRINYQVSRICRPVQTISRRVGDSIARVRSTLSAFPSYLMRIIVYEVFVSIASMGILFSNHILRVLANNPCIWPDVDPSKYLKC